MHNSLLRSGFFLSQFRYILKWRHKIELSDFSSSLQELSWHVIQIIHVLIVVCDILHLITSKTNTLPCSPPKCFFIISVLNKGFENVLLLKNCSHNWELSIFDMDLSYFKTNYVVGMTNYFGNIPRLSVSASVWEKIYKDSVSSNWVLWNNISLLTKCIHYRFLIVLSLIEILAVGPSHR